MPPQIADRRVTVMPSQKQSKLRRREARVAAEEARRRSPRGGVARRPHPARAPRTAQVPSRERQASPKVLLGAAAVLALIAVGIGIAVVAMRGGSSHSAANVPSRGSLANALPGAGRVNGLFGGIPQQGNALGPPNAPVTLIAYIDAQCPYCREFEATSLPRLVARYVRSGKLRIEARPIAILGPDSIGGARAIIAAGRQDRLFNYAELLYFNQGAENTGWLSNEMVTAVAASVPGLDVPRLLQDRDSGAVKDQQQVFASSASAADVDRTPTILVGPTGGTLGKVTLTSPADPGPVAAAIDRALAG
jgi:protein-disulfide isomerase